MISLSFCLTNISVTFLSLFSLTPHYVKQFLIKFVIRVQAWLLENLDI